MIENHPRTTSHIMDAYLLFGSSNPQLTSTTHQVALNLDLFKNIGQISVQQFSDGETRVELPFNVRESTVFLLQTTQTPANDNFMEMMLTVDALRRSSASKIVVVSPYYGYARQDRRPGYSRVPISASVIAKTLEAVGVDHLVTVDLHSTQIQGFFSIPVDNLGANKLFIDHISSMYAPTSGDTIIVSPDVGGVARARALATPLNLDLAIIDKRRPAANVSEVMNVIGDIDGKRCIIVDDMVDTAGTLVKAARALRSKGATDVVAYATHGVLSGQAFTNLEDAALSRLVVTDSIYNPLTSTCDKVQQLKLSNLLMQTCMRILHGESVSELMSISAHI